MKMGLLARFLADAVSLRIIVFLRLVGGLLQLIQLLALILASILEIQMTTITATVFKITHALQ